MDKSYELSCSCGEKFFANETDVAILPETKGFGARAKPVLVPYVSCPNCEDLVNIRDIIADEHMRELCQEWSDPLLQLWAYGYVFRPGFDTSSDKVSVNCCGKNNQFPLNEVSVLRRQEDEGAHESLEAIVICPDCFAYHIVDNQITAEAWEWLAEIGRQVVWSLPDQWRNTIHCKDSSCGLKVTVASRKPLFVRQFYRDNEKIPEVCYRCPDSECNRIVPITDYTYPELRYILILEWRMNLRKSNSPDFEEKFFKYTCRGCSHEQSVSLDKAQIDEDKAGPYAYMLCPICQAEQRVDVKSKDTALWYQLLSLLDIQRELDELEFEEVIV